MIVNLYPCFSTKSKHAKWSHTDIETYNDFYSKNLNFNNNAAKK